MRVDIIHRNHRPSKRVTDHVEARAAKFAKYIQSLDQARFTLTEEKLDRICEVNVHYKGRDFHASATSEDMLASVDKACQSMEKQLRRFKRKLTDHRARFDQLGLTSAAALEAASTPLEEEAEEEEV